MTKHNLLKKISLGIASLALICPLAMSGLNNTNVNARRRHDRTHRVYRHHKRARRHARRNHRHNRENILEAEGYENNYYKPTRHHESMARWYKNNALRMYTHNFYTNAMFRKGVNYGDSGCVNGLSKDTTDNNYPNLRRKYINNSQFKHGWIISYATQDINAEYLGLDKNSVKHATVRDYQHALDKWNDGANYVKHFDRNHLAVYDYDLAHQWTTNSNM